MFNSDSDLSVHHQIMMHTGSLESAKEMLELHVAQATLLCSANLMHAS